MNDKIEGIEELNAALKYVKTFKVAVDGGANRGDWTKELATKFEEVYAFEPHAGAYSSLAYNMKHTSNVFMIEQALGDRFGDVGLHVRRKSGWTDAYVDKEGSGTDMVPLDHYKLKDVGLIKLDLEGFEYHALVGATDTLRRNKPVVVIESIPKFEARFGLKYRAAVGFLESLGFKEVERFPPNRIFVWE